MGRAKRALGGSDVWTFKMFRASAHAPLFSMCYDLDTNFLSPTHLWISSCNLQCGLSCFFSAIASRCSFSAHLSLAYFLVCRLWPSHSWCHIFPCCQPRLWIPIFNLVHLNDVYMLLQKSMKFKLFLQVPLFPHYPSTGNEDSTVLSARRKNGNPPATFTKKRQKSHWNITAINNFCVHDCVHICVHVHMCIFKCHHLKPPQVPLLRCHSSFIYL